MAFLNEGLVRLCKRYASAAEAISPPSPHNDPENPGLRFASSKSVLLYGHSIVLMTTGG
jgi:hypothetical protein